MKYAKVFFISVLIYIGFYLVKIFVVNNLADEFLPINPAIKLGLDCVWLVTTIYVWRVLTKKQTNDSEPNSNTET